MSLPSLSPASAVEVSLPTVSVPSISAWSPYHHGSPSSSRLPPASPLSVCYSSPPAAPSPLPKHVRPVPRSLFPSPMRSHNCDALALLWPTLKRLERKIDYLTSLQERPSIKPHETSSWHTAPTNDKTTKSPEVLLPSNHSECSVSSDILVQICKGASSSKNFAVCLMREMFQHTELVGRNMWRARENAG